MNRQQFYFLKLAEKAKTWFSDDRYYALEKLVTDNDIGDSDAARDALDELVRRGYLEKVVVKVDDGDDVEYYALSDETLERMEE